MRIQRLFQYPHCTFMRKIHLKTDRRSVRLIIIMLILLSISSFLIYIGSRGDATSVAQRIKSGVLTADEVNIAFENVGGRLLSRKVKESDFVKKGQVLMVLDDKDTSLSIQKVQAQIQAQEASIRQQQEAIKIQTQDCRLQEISQWRQIEQFYAALKAAQSAEKLAKVEFGRSKQLINSKSISKSAYDTNESAQSQATQARIQAQRQLDSISLGATAEQKEKLRTTGSAEGMTLTAIENTRANIKNMDNTLSEMKARLKELNTELDMLNLNYERLTLRAPEDGKILKLLYQEGEMISPNAPAVLLESSRKYFDIYVNEKQVLNYKEKQKVTANVIATDEEVSGIIRFVTAAPSFADLRMTREHGQADLTMFKVRVYLEKPESCLAGMTLEVKND